VMGGEELMLRRLLNGGHRKTSLIPRGASRFLFLVLFHGDLNSCAALYYHLTALSHVPARDNSLCKFTSHMYLWLFSPRYRTTSKLCNRAGEGGGIGEIAVFPSPRIFVVPVSGSAPDGSAVRL
jgi:hypothetical protein